MWLKRLFGRGEEASPGGQAQSTKEKEQSREDAQKDFMDEQVRQRDEDESRMQDEGVLDAPRSAVRRYEAQWRACVAELQAKPTALGRRPA
jgi:hypothetical protein